MAPLTRRCIPVLLIATLAATALGHRCSVAVEQVQVEGAGFVEPHTPGSDAPEEMAPSDRVRAIAGPHPDLNRTLTVRTFARYRRPRAVLILMPGFLAGASSFDPMARDVVKASRGAVQVWAIDRRSNLLEDRRGARAARWQVELGAFLGFDELVRAGLEAGTRFYFDPVDLDGDGAPEPPYELRDASGARSDFLRLDSDDMRFAAHWGVDTILRDLRALVDEARALLGPDGVVVVGGHSFGSTWAGLYAAYDFDPGPGVDAAHDGIDGVLLLEGSGPPAPSANAPDLATYRARVADLESPGGPDVFLTTLFFVNAVSLGPAAELNGLAGRFDPDAPAILQKTNLFGGFPINLLLAAPMTNQALVGFFLDDDFSSNAAFNASFGFSDNGPNARNPFAPLLTGDFLVADATLEPELLRTWKDFDDPDLPRCPPNDPAPELGNGGTGCAVEDKGPRPAPDSPPARWGVEREVTDMEVLLTSLYDNGNASEWYYLSGRPDLDLLFGRDSTALGAPELLNVSRNAAMDAPILAVGASNGETPTEASFADYLDSVATDPADRQVVIVEGYAHQDILSARDNDAVAPVVDWVEQLVRRKRSGHRGHTGNLGENGN